MKEIWMPIPNWEELYEVSNMGNVRNKKTKKLRVLDMNNCGYYRITLYNKERERMFIHRLVATVFIETDDYNKQVNHIDGDKSNNCVSNLEWVTQSENEMHAIKNNLKGSWNGNFIVEYGNGEIEIKDNQRAFSREIGVSKTLVRKWLAGEYDTYKKLGIRNIYFCNKSSTTIESIS